MRVGERHFLSGPGTDLPGAGTVVGLEVDDSVASALIESWRAALAPLCAEREWAGASLHPRRLAGGVVLGLRAPTDLRDLAERAVLWGLEAAQARLAGEPPPDELEYERLREAAAQRHDPALRALEAAAARRGVAFLRDGRKVSVGMGAGSQSWPTGDLPAPEDIDWTRIRDIPVAVLTGDRDVRSTGALLAAMIVAAGGTGGRCSSEGIRIGGETLTTDPSANALGARWLLRDRRVELAVIEIEPERLLREGVAFTGADSAAVLSAAPDPVSRYGTLLPRAMAEIELSVLRSLRPGAPLALDADEPALLRAGPRATARIHWYTRDPSSDVARAHVGAGGDLTALQDGMVVRTRSGALVPILPLEEAAVDGEEGLTAVLAAVATASGLGLPWRALAAGLRGEKNPG